MAMSQMAGKDTWPKPAWKMKSSGFTNSTRKFISEGNKVSRVLIHLPFFTFHKTPPTTNDKHWAISITWASSHCTLHEQIPRREELYINGLIRLPPHGDVPPCLRKPIKGYETFQQLMEVDSCVCFNGADGQVWLWTEDALDAGWF